MTLLNVSNLNVSIGDEDILKDLSFKIREGQIFGLIGGSGSGKSMTAFSIINLLPRKAMLSGSIVLGSDEITCLSEKKMCSVRGADIGMVFQEPMTALNPLQTIGQQIAEPLVIHKKCSVKNALLVAQKLADRVGLSEGGVSLDRYPHELSGGQRQRVVIAQAFILKPKLLIADELTTALDVSTQANILNLLKELVQNEGVSVLLITHDLAVIAEFSDEFVIMEKGQIVERNITGKISLTANYHYTKKLIKDSQFSLFKKSKMVSPKILEVDRATLTYKKKTKGFLSFEETNITAVDDVSFSLCQGENLGIIGESGSGKSTLARSIIGLESLNRGKIKLDGKNILPTEKMTFNDRTKMQIVFQDPFGSFNPRHQVGRLISEPFFLLRNEVSSKEITRLVDNILDEVGLSSKDRMKYIHEFSGGERQRIAIARALVIKPRLIILDEPVSSLDSSIRGQILDLLFKLSKNYRVSYLFVSHDLSVVRSITDKLIVMKRGKIVEEGDTERVFEKPSHAYTKKLIDSIPKIPDNWRTKA